MMLRERMKKHSKYGVNTTTRVVDTHIDTHTHTLKKTDSKTDRHTLTP